MRKNDSMWENVPKPAGTVAPLWRLPWYPSPSLPGAKDLQTGAVKLGFATTNRPASQAVIPQLSTREFRDNSRGAMLLSLCLQHFHAG